jgi:hypothetical protein
MDFHAIAGGLVAIMTALLLVLFALNAWGPRAKAVSKSSTLRHCRTITSRPSARPAAIMLLVSSWSGLFI